MKRKVCGFVFAFLFAVTVLHIKHVLDSKCGCFAETNSGCIYEISTYCLGD